MARYLFWNIYTASGDLIAKTAYAEDAAAMVSAHGTGAKVKANGRIVWTEGKDGSAGESYDNAAALMQARRTTHHKQAMRRAGYAVDVLG